MSQEQNQNAEIPDENQLLDENQKLIAQSRANSDDGHDQENNVIGIGNGRQINVQIVDDNKSIKNNNLPVKDDPYQDQLLQSPVLLKDEFQATNSSHFGMSMISASDIEQSPGQFRGGNNKNNQLPDRQKQGSVGFNKHNHDDDEDEEGYEEQEPMNEVVLPADVYRDVVNQFPANPLLPKSFHAKDDSPRSGGLFKFMKLTKFRGMDHGRSKFREEALKIEKIPLPEGITIRKIFKIITKNQDQPDEKDKDKQKEKPIPEEAPLLASLNRQERNLTPFGELVYQRAGSYKDFLQKKQSFAVPGQPDKDEVLEENLMDVRNLLKNATSSQAAHGKQAGSKALVNLAGVEPFYEKRSRFDKTLIFESRFESGNLAAALKVSDQDYYLALQNDVNTSGNTQWFFFRVSNTKSFNVVRFSLLNLCKPDSLYNEGMKVLVYSEKHAAAKDIGWHRGGTKISYYQNGIRKEGTKNFRSLYTLTFTYDFEYDDDNVFFAYCYPYTYTELQDELNMIMADPVKQQYVQRKTLTETLAGNKCELLTITSKQNPENMAKRKGVILTARVHPGESVGSWMMKGALDFLVDPNSIEAEYLRQHFVFKVIPMLNPDGVINGNYRCSLAGCDLNRRWKRPSKVLHPTIFATKQLCHQFSKERELQIFCDFHGHSRRKNIFMYGCNVPNQPEETRLFPFIMSQICPFFVYNHSRFGNQKSKESTARMSLFNELKCPAIYTIESSFCGNDIGPYKNYHFSTNNLMQTGRDFCRTLMLYLPIQVPKSITAQFMQNISDLYNQYKIISESTGKPNIDVDNMEVYFDRLNKVKAEGKEVQSKHLKKGLLAVLRQTADIFTDGNQSSTDGSCQAPSDDNLDVEEIEKVLPIQEDPELALLLKKSKTLKMNEEKKEEVGLNKGGTEISPLKRRNTINEANLKRKNLTKGQSGASIKNRNRRVTLNLQGKKIDELEENDADDEEDTFKKDEDDKDKLEEKDQVLELRDQDSGNIIHKKRRRKNVESKDAVTQTDRSDYMLIKQRQQEKQKQLVRLLAEKSQGSGLRVNEHDVLNPSSELTIQQQIRELGGGDSEITQKLLEEYLDHQKQGLVQNIVNHYQNTPIALTNSERMADFTSFIAQRQMEKGQAYNQDDHSPMNRPSATSNQEYLHPSNSPSKKHRHLIQSRVGAAQISGATGPLHAERTSSSQGLQAHTPQLGNKRAGLNTHHGQRANKQYLNQLINSGNQANKNIQYVDNRLQSSQGSAAKPQTHWQKVSTSNHELTKLFYQLPGGTKSLVQNAIQSYNQSNAYNQPYTSSNKKNKFGKKQLQTPEVNRHGLVDDLPDISSSANFSGANSANKTPNHVISKTQHKDNYSAFTSSGISNKGQVFFEKSPNSIGPPQAQHSGFHIDVQTGMVIQPLHSAATTSKKPPIKARNLGNLASGSMNNVHYARPQTRGHTETSSNNASLAKNPGGNWNQQQRNDNQSKQRPLDNYDVQKQRGAENTANTNSQHQLQYLEIRENNSNNQIRAYQGSQKDVPPNAQHGKMIRASDQNGELQYFVPGQQQATIGGTSFSNIYVGQALAASSGTTQTRYKGNLGTSKISINGNLAPAPQNATMQVFDNRSSRPELIHQAALQPLIKGEIMENKFIQEKLQNLNINGDLRDIEELGDQITAQIVQKLNKQNNNPNSQNQVQGQHGNPPDSQINVYNNFQSSNNPGGGANNAASRKGLSIQKNQNMGRSGVGAPGSHQFEQQMRHNDKFKQLGGTISSQQTPQEPLQSRNKTNTRVKTANPTMMESSSKTQNIPNSKITNQYLQPGGHHKNNNQKRLQSSSKQNIKMIESAQNNFIHVQRIIPSGSLRPNIDQGIAISRAGDNLQPVTQIVNVHNQFNISNNIIIDSTGIKSNNEQESITASTRGGKPPTIVQNQGTRKKNKTKVLK